MNEGNIGDLGVGPVRQSMARVFGLCVKCIVARNVVML